MSTVSRMMARRSLFRSVAVAAVVVPASLVAGCAQEEPPQPAPVQAPPPAPAPAAVPPARG